MTADEARELAFDKSYAAHLAHMASTGDAGELQQEADDWNALADALDAVQELQATPHAPGCASREIGSTDSPWCDCGRNALIQQAGGRAHR